MTVYLAGKITGDPDYREKFSKAEQALQAVGLLVVNPAILPSTGFEYDAYMRMSSAMLAECEAACFLPDWTESRGAMYEYGYAVAHGTRIFYFDAWLKARKRLRLNQTGTLAFQCLTCESLFRIFSQPSFRPILLPFCLVVLALRQQGGVLRTKNSAKCCSKAWPRLDPE